MNHIQALIERNKQLATENAALRAAAFDFKVHLSTNEKFLGEEPDGGRKDWLSTKEALAWLRNIEMVEQS
jgi:hypothetical protein